MEELVPVRIVLAAYNKAIRELVTKVRDNALEGNQTVDSDDIIRIIGDLWKTVDTTVEVMLDKVLEDIISEEKSGYNSNS